MLRTGDIPCPVHIRTMMGERLKTDAVIYISVILPLKLEWEPCYASMEEVDAGDRVRVMFAGKEYLGVVSETAVKPDVDVSKIKTIMSVERSLARVTSREIMLWRQVASYYMCSVGEVYKAAYPLQKVSSEEVLARKAARLEKRQKAVKEAEIRKLKMITARLEKKQILLSRAKRQDIKEKYSSEIRRLQDELDLISTGVHRQRIPGREDTAVQIPGSGTALTDAQTEAADAAREAFGKRKTVLLKGVTGSGKTEIYIKLASEALSKGKNVLYLVPEIALGRQLEYRLEDTFKDMLMVFHSGESAARRTEVAARTRDSRYIVLGTRSAIFLPHNNLGLIIVDEEHDSSYKQESPAPRYNGRDTAIMLAGIHGSNILLGSATPSLESLHNCVTGKFELAELDVRYHESEDADIEIIDTIAERKKRGMEGSFSLTLIGHIRDALSRGEQVMLFRARRAYSTALQCTVCGTIPKCPHCNVSLSWHKGNGASGEDGELSGGRMVCHYCGYGTAFTGRCPECGGLLKGLGAGTQKIEEETAAIFPEAKIARLDSDSAQRQTYSKDVIRKFSRGEIDILIGTQMVTKGFDFPGLSLVAVLQADTLLSVQDFRADERAAQLLEQFRGRCGRRGKKGLFVIQTSTPEHPIYRILSGQETVPERSLLMERKMFGFPPYTRIVNICIRDTMEIRAERMGTKLAGFLESGTPPYELTGPYSPAIDKVSDRFIRIIRLTLKKDRHLAATKRLLGEKISDFEQAEKYEGHIVIDVDPA